jgi:hypothetical protein
MKEIDDLLFDTECLYKSVRSLTDVSLRQAINPEQLIQYHKKEMAIDFGRTIALKGDWIKESDPVNLHTNITCSAYIFNRKEIRKILDAAFCAGLKYRKNLTL